MRVKRASNWSAGRVPLPSSVRTTLSSAPPTTALKRSEGVPEHTVTLGSKRQPKSAQSVRPSPSLSMPSAQTSSVRSPSRSPCVPMRSSTVWLRPSSGRSSLAPAATEGLPEACAAPDDCHEPRQRVTPGPMQSWSSQSIIPSASLSIQSEQRSLVFSPAPPD